MLATDVLMTTAVLLRSEMMGNYHVPFWRAVEGATPSLTLIIGRKSKERRFRLSQVYSKACLERSRK
ncbi:MAG: hypothetical protein ACYTXY_49445, partial [Nostoc sp.]